MEADSFLGKSPHDCSPSWHTAATVETLSQKTELGYG